MISKLSFAACICFAMAIVLGNSLIQAQDPEYQRFPYYWPNCPDGFDITTQEECSKAIASLGVTSVDSWTGSRTTMPRFCSLQKNTDSTIFNTDPTGDQRRWDLAPVCKWTGKEAPPDFFRVSRENVTEWRGVEHTITVKPEEWDYFLAFQESRKNGFSCPCNPDIGCNEIEAPGKHWHPPNPERATFDCTLWIAAWMHAEDQCIQGYFSHNSRDGFSPRMRCEEIGAVYRGEHQAGRHSTGLGALRGLQSSPGHCNSMFDPSFRGFASAHGARRNDPRGDGDVWTVLYNGGGSDISDSVSCIPEGYTATGERIAPTPTAPTPTAPTPTAPTPTAPTPTAPTPTAPTPTAPTPTPPTPTTPVGNVHVKYYEFVDKTSLPAEGLKSLTPYAEDFVENIDFQSGSGTFASSGRENDVAALFEGYLDFPLSDNYWICINSDDGSKVFIDDSLLINNDGLHGVTQECSSYETSAGVKKVQIEYFQRSGDAVLYLEYVPLSRPSWFRLMRVVDPSEFVPKPEDFTNRPSESPSARATSLEPSDTPSVSPTIVPSLFPSTAPTSSSFCTASEFQDSIITFEAFNACWKADISENGVLVGDFVYPQCLGNDLKNGQIYSLFDGFDNTSNKIKFTNVFTNLSGYFTITQSPDVTDIEVSQNEYNPNTKKFAIDLLAPSCVAPGSCSAEGFLGETFYVKGFGACFEIQLVEGGILGMNPSDPNCSRKDSTGQVVISKFSGVDGRNIYFNNDNDPNHWSGTFLLKESSDATGPEIQNPIVDGNAKEFLIDLFVPTCKN